MMAKAKDRAEAEAAGPAGRLEQAARVALAREARTESPEGEWSDSLWWPSAQERRPCCEGITPSPANRQALESHCRTQRHVAQLFDVPLEDLKRAVRRSRAGAAAARPAAAVLEGGVLLELVRVSAETREQARRELREAVAELGAMVPQIHEELAASEEAGDFRQLLSALLADLERLQAIVEFNRSVEDAYQSARSVQEALENLRGLKKESAA